MRAHAGGSKSNHLLLYLERTQTTQTRLRRSNASLSLTCVRELLPQPLWRCFSDEFNLLATTKRLREQVTSVSE